MDHENKPSLRQRLKPRERSPKVTWALTVCLLVCATLGTHLL